MKIFYIAPLLLACWGLAFEASAQNAVAKTSKPAAKPWKLHDTRGLQFDSYDDVPSNVAEQVIGERRGEAVNA